MAKDQACKLQILSAKHPDLLQAVDGMLKKFATVQEVRQMIERRYHEDAGETAVSTYKKKHFLVFKAMVRDQKAAMVAISEIIGEDGLTAGVNALLWQELQSMTATQLMAFKKVLNDGEKVALMKKQFALFAQEHRQRMKERAAALEAGKDGAEVVEDFDAARRMVEQAKEIFGIGRTAFPPPAQKLLNARQEVQPPMVGTDLPNERAEEPPLEEDPAAAGKESVRRLLNLGVLKNEG